MKIPCKLVATMAGIWLLGLHGLTSHAEVFAFTDQQGVLHLSDVPADSRYHRVLVAPQTEVPPAASSMGAAPSVTSVSHPEVRRIVEREARAQQVDAALVLAVIRAESNYNPQAVSPKGARGLMQLMPDTARRHGVRDVHDPEQNIRAGVRHLAWLMGRFRQDLRLALAAYNAGEGAVAAHGNQVPPYRETRQYVPRVLEYYASYRSQLPLAPAGT
jgi:soluble lytic murein transglycosylase-like protein